MDATTMHSMSSLVARLQSDYPQFTFILGDTFKWAPSSQSINYDESSGDLATLLHELSHAILQHSTYNKDIELIEMERDAWQYASTTLAPNYQTTVDSTAIQESLDTYRDWLHARSTCPSCQAIGIQIKKHTYSCLACSTKWRVNDARVCALRRYTL